MFVETKVCLSWQNFCHNKITFVATNICRKDMFVTTKIKLCRNKHFVRTKILVEAPAKDRWQTTRCRLYSLISRPSQRSVLKTSRCRLYSLISRPRQWTDRVHCTCGWPVCCPGVCHPLWRTADWSWSSGLRRSGGQRWCSASPHPPSTGWSSWTFPEALM